MKPSQSGKACYNGSAAKVEVFMGNQPEDQIDKKVSSLASPTVQLATAKGRTVK